MALKSLRSLKLPLTAAGKPEVVYQEILAPLYAIPQSAVLICSEPNPVRVAQLTFGLETFVRDDTDLTLLIVVSEDAAQSSTSEILRQTWRSALESEPVARRLSLYRLFAERKRLRILFRSTAQRGESDPLRVHLAEAPAIVLVSDAEGTQVEVMWKTQLTFDKQSDVSALIRWSFGDPQRRVGKLGVAVSRIAAMRSFNPQVEATLSELVGSLPSPGSSWEESFAEAY